MKKPKQRKYILKPNGDGWELHNTKTNKSYSDRFGKVYIYKNKDLAYQMLRNFSAIGMI